MPVSRSSAPIDVSETLREPAVRMMSMTQGTHRWSPVRPISPAMFAANAVFGSSRNSWIFSVSVSSRNGRPSSVPGKNGWVVGGGAVSDGVVSGGPMSSTAGSVAVACSSGDSPTGAWVVTASGCDVSGGTGLNALEQAAASTLTATAAQISFRIRRPSLWQPPAAPRSGWLG